MSRLNSLWLFFCLFRWLWGVPQYTHIVLYWGKKELPLRLFSMLQLHETGDALLE